MKRGWRDPSKPALDPETSPPLEFPLSYLQSSKVDPGEDRARRFRNSSRSRVTWRSWNKMVSNFSFICLTSITAGGGDDALLVVPVAKVQTKTVLGGGIRKLFKAQAIYLLGKGGKMKELSAKHVTYKGIINSPGFKFYMLTHRQPWHAAPKHAPPCKPKFCCQNTQDPENCSLWTTKEVLFHMVVENSLTTTKVPSNTHQNSQGGRYHYDHTHHIMI